MKREDLIVPIRTRGPIQQYPGESGRAIPRATKRGPIVLSLSPKVDLDPPPKITLERLVKDLREQVGPLTLLVHGWGSATSGAFLDTLSPLLHKEDALWLVPDGGTSTSQVPAQAEGAVVLDLNRDTDSRIYRNMVGDIAFFPAIDEDEAAQVARWQQRVRTVVIGQGPQTRTLLKAGRTARLRTFRWSGEATLEEYEMSSAGGFTYKS